LTEDLDRFAFGKMHVSFQRELLFSELEHKLLCLFAAMGDDLDPGIKRLRLKLAQVLRLVANRNFMLLRQELQEHT